MVLFFLLCSEEEAKKKIYSVATIPYTGFGAEISEELSQKVKSMALFHNHISFCLKFFGRATQFD